MSPHDSKSFRFMLREWRRLKNPEKHGQRKERPPSRAALLRDMEGHFSIVCKRIKGCPYYYLREQRRRARQLLQRDKFLGRMGFDALPVWLQEIYKSDPSAFEFRADAPDKLGTALEWWGRIQILADNAESIARGAGRTRPHTKRDERFLKCARGNIAALELAQRRNARNGRGRPKGAQ